MKPVIAAFFASLVFVSPLMAQEADPAAPPDGAAAAEVATDTEVIAATGDLADIFPDFDDWTALTARVETALETRRASSTVLGNLRSEVADWRDMFLVRQTVNAERIATVRAQIAALGVAAETEAEDSRVAARRDDLNAQLARLRAPVILAVEAHTQASGLIAEIDTLIRDRQTDRFTERSQSPLNPVGWAGTLDAAVTAAASVSGEITSNIGNPARRAAFQNVLPPFLALLAVAFICILRGRVWFARLAHMLVARVRRGQGALQFILSMGQVLVPFVGLLAFTQAAQISGMTGRRLDAIFAMIPLLGLLPILAHWIAGQLFPKDAMSEADHPLNMADDASAKAHRRFVWLGYSLFAFGLVHAIVSVNAFDVVPATVAVFPFGVLMGWALHRFGHMLRAPQPEGDTETSKLFRQTLRDVLSRLLKIAAVVGVTFAALGYANAFAVIIWPAALTAFLAAILVLVQRLSVDIYSFVSRSENAAQTALMPVVISFALIVLSLPVLAIVWGAQVTDLTELWAQFREGYSFGETRISPTSFLLFALVFMVGYAVTRMVQAALRTTVLPRTKLDAGGQNAIVAGTSYLGIFLAAIIAITTAGIDLSGLAIVAGALSVGIGFGMQNIVSNFVSGIILLIERPISKGDWIEVGGQMGYVRDISVRSTRIETFDRTDVIVPNADLVSNQVTNWTRGNSVGRVIVPVGVAYGTDTDWVTGLLQEIAEAHPMVLLNPPPKVFFIGFGADSLDFEIRAILRDVNFGVQVKSDMNHAIARKFLAEGIEIPFGQRDIWLRNPETLRSGDPAHRRPNAASAPLDDAPAKDAPDT